MGIELVEAHECLKYWLNLRHKETDFSDDNINGHSSWRLGFSKLYSLSVLWRPIGLNLISWMLHFRCFGCNSAGHSFPGVLLFLSRNFVISLFFKITI